MVLFTVYIIILSISFLSSLISFKLHYPFHLKLFSILLGITLLVEYFASFGLHFLKTKSNIPLYNAFMLVEFEVYAWYFLQIIRFPLIKKVIAAFLILFPLFWVTTVFFIFGIEHWNSYLVIAGSAFTVFLSGIFYYQLFTASELTKLTKSPEFWIATGLIVFYTCNLPFLGMFNFLTRNYETLAYKLEDVLQLLDAVMYSTFIYAFLCRMTNIARF
jgi:hypothetical protein